MNQKQKKVLLKLARETIEKTFEDKKVDLDSKELNDKIFEEKRGAFVTLHKKGVGMRGCIGFVYPILELKKAIADGAVEAAFHDPRFPPLQKEELKDIKTFFGRFKDDLPKELWQEYRSLERRLKKKKRA